MHQAVNTCGVATCCDHIYIHMYFNDLVVRPSWYYAMRVRACMFKSFGFGAHKVWQCLRERVRRCADVFIALTHPAMGRAARVVR